MRVVFMGTPEFAVGALEAVHRAFTIVGVYSQPDRASGRGMAMTAPPVKRKALELALPVFQPEKMNLPGEFERLRALSPDVIVVVAFGQILKQEVLDLPRYGCVNIHSSLLPRWRGAAPIQWAILGGDAESGVTTMKLVQKLDAGSILMQAKTPLQADETAGSLHDRLARMGAELIVPTLHGLADGSLKGREQDEALVTYASKLTKEMEWLNPQEKAVLLDRRVRALNPWPGTSVWVNAGGWTRLKIKRAKLWSGVSGPVGKIFDRAGMPCLATSEGALEIQLCQWDGKKEVDSAGFLNGLQGRALSLPLDAMAERPAEC
jgi:methionyl-tRNA formyltransferase